MNGDEIQLRIVVAAAALPWSPSGSNFHLHHFFLVFSFPLFYIGRRKLTVPDRVSNYTSTITVLLSLPTLNAASPGRYLNCRLERSAPSSSSHKRCLFNFCHLRNGRNYLTHPKRRAALCGWLHLWECEEVYRRGLSHKNCFHFVYVFGSFGSSEPVLMLAWLINSIRCYGF